jgi:hypothetical protein
MYCFSTYPYSSNSSFGDQLTAITVQFSLISCILKQQKTFQISKHRYQPIKDVLADVVAIII